MSFKEIYPIYLKSEMLYYITMEMNAGPKKKPVEQPKKPLISLNGIIMILSGLLIILTLVVFATIYGGGMELLVSESTTLKDAFRSYDVQKDFGGGHYRVQFTDLMTSAGGKEKHYYRYDLSVETEDKKSATEIIKIRGKIITIINGVMSTFPPNEMNTAPERNRVKSIIQTEVTWYYPNIKVKDIYFTNFLYD
ncbi:MAG: hypothetical protein C0603_11530 [Denitrovibrio sp.]|nr:MAG: hypothetical protein C0603_11530 [Denitrovibrio sp.]